MGGRGGLMPFWHVHGSSKIQRNFRHAAAQISIAPPEIDPRAAYRNARARRPILKSAWRRAPATRQSHGARRAGATRRGTARGHCAFVAFQRPRTVQRNAAQFSPARDSGRHGTARNGTALRLTSALRDDSHEETTEFRFAVTKVSFEIQKTEITE